MPDGGCLTIETGEVSLSDQYADAHVEVTPGHYVQVCVSDNGAGMPAEVRERAFEPFFTTKARGKGTGLGLSTIFGFVKQSGGHVSIYSEESVGTTVKLYLPAVDATPENRTVADTEEDEVESPAGDETVLVVDDDDAARETAVGAVESYGYTTLSAANGADALEVLKAHPGVALLFTDIVMPGGMNGIELARRARELRPGLNVLFTSGYTEEALERSDYGKGNGYWIAKPYHIDELARKIRRVLDSPPVDLS